MADWQIMAHMVTLPIEAEQPLSLPAGWEPIGTLARQANEAVVFCRRQAADSTPPADPPVIDQLDPATLATGGPPATVDVYGSNFASGCTITVSDVARDTFYIDSGHLQYTARPDLAPAGEYLVKVVNDVDLVSNAMTFTYT